MPSLFHALTRSTWCCKISTALLRRAAQDRLHPRVQLRKIDATSMGVALQAEQRKAATDEGYSEPHLWTGVGRARSGCGAALVGSVDQVMSKIERYQKMGIRSFIFSGYPHQAECEIFGNKVLPQLKTCSLPEVYGRIPASTPPTPLGIGERK